MSDVLNLTLLNQIDKKSNLHKTQMVTSQINILVLFRTTQIQFRQTLIIHFRPEGIYLKVETLKHASRKNSKKKTRYITVY